MLVLVLVLELLLAMGHGGMRHEWGPLLLVMVVVVTTAAMAAATVATTALAGGNVDPKRPVAPLLAHKLSVEGEGAVKGCTVLELDKA